VGILVAMSVFDVWVIRFEPGERPPAERLQDAFGIDGASARALEQSVPKIIKHGVHAQAAAELREALQAIGAVVECRPARQPKAGEGVESAAVFHPPGADLFPTGASVAPSKPAAGAPRVPVAEPIAPSREVEARPISTSPSAVPPELRHRKLLQQAVASLLGGFAIMAVDWFLGSSVLRGEASWVGIGFDGLGIFLLGLGAHGLVVTLRS
jgi:hypothetical protein